MSRRMPGYIIHLTEAKMIGEILQKQKARDYSQEWEKAFFYGALLPDAVKKAKKGISHFWRKNAEDQIAIVPDIDNFLNKYTVTEKDSLSLGYLAHLHLDKVFWQEYIRENVSFLDIDRCRTESAGSLKYVFVNKKKIYITPKDFFSEKYLYGDYTKLNIPLIRKYALKIPVFDKEYTNVIEEADNLEMENLLQKLNQYLLKQKHNDHELKVFQQENLEQFLRNTAVKFVQQYT